MCGLDHLGVRTIDELRARDEIVVGIGPTADAEEHLTDVGARLVVGDPRLTRVLREAEVEAAAVIVLTGDDDLANLNAALAAFELNPAIRIVIRMFDQELGAHIPDLFPDAVALSSSALAAPGFVSAAIDGETGTRFVLAGRVITSRESADAAGSPDSVVIARLNADRTVEPLPDAAVTDPNLILIDVSERGAGGSAEAVRPPLPAPRARPIRDPSNRDGGGFSGALGSRFASRDNDCCDSGSRSSGWRSCPPSSSSRGPPDATRRNLIRDHATDRGGPPRQHGHGGREQALRIYAIFLSLVGAAIVAVVYAFITDALIRSRLLQTLGRRTIPGGIHDHVIVAGLGSIGYRVALGIAARGVQVVAIEVSDDGRFVSPTRAAGIPVFIGDVRHREVLEQLHIGTARAIVAATSDDLVNLSAALNARPCGPTFAWSFGFTIRTSRSASSRGSRSGSRGASRSSPLRPSRRPPSARRSSPRSRSVTSG